MNVKELCQSLLRHASSEVPHPFSIGQGLSHRKLPHGTSHEKRRGCIFQAGTINPRISPKSGPLPIADNEFDCGIEQSFCLGIMHKRKSLPWLVQLCPLLP
jgi:hypothetical protein